MTRARFVALPVAFACLTALPAQRGGRPSAFAERLQCSIADVKLPAKPEGEDRFTSLPFVADKQKKQELVVLYLIDSSNDVPKREAFESILFGHEDMAVHLRCFHVARVDIAADPEAQAKYGKRLPVFLAYDENGKLCGDVALTGYKAAVTPVTPLLDKAAAGHVKPTLAMFVDGYRGLVHDLEAVDQKRKALQARTAKLDDASKKAALERELKALDEEEKKLLADEQQMLQRAKVPQQDPAAKRFEPKRGR